MKLFILVFAGFFGSGQLAEAFSPQEARFDRGRMVLEKLNARACEESRRLPPVDQELASFGRLFTRDTMEAACETDVALALDLAQSSSSASAKSTGSADGDLLGRMRLMAGFGIAVDLVAYSSSGLAVAGVLCYPDDGQPHSTVMHLHGGLGGIFENPDGNMLETCVNWALLHHRTAFAPSYRGQDGGEGSLELCLGEADDVAAGATLLRSMKETDPDRIAVVGGSTGGCIALRAGAMIPGLRAVVSYVPPADWKALVAYHRAFFTPEIENNCGGGSTYWDTGGPQMADVFDNIICGHPGCSDADYAARSTIPGVFGQTAPTLIISAETDNLVPLEQQILYSQLRSQLGNHVDIYVVGKCDDPSAPPLADDIHVMVSDAYHALSPAAISSGLLFVMDALDR